ncbi:MAG: glycosyltransferase [Lachnospiraceae bacterium]|nr:glycosyltransferase [Lachnospiraceae bacterium]
MTPFSICIIAKNEEKRIDRCLSAASKLNAEIVVIDTGSTDKTKELALKYTDKIYDFEWCNDFSAARNFSIDKAGHDWILVLDCDEYVEDFDIQKLQEFMEPTFHHYVGVILRRNQMNNDDTCMDDWVERFFHRKHFHYEGIIHEQVRDNRGCAIARCEIPITVYHDGYVDTPENLQKKALRNETLLLEALKKEPDNPYIYHQLGQAASMAGKTETAAQYYEKGLSYNPSPDLYYAQLMTVAYGETLLSLHRYKDALQLEKVYNDYAHIADFLCLMGLIYIRNNEPLKAILEFLKAISAKEHWREDTTNTFPRYHIGLIYEAMGDLKNACTFFLSCGDYAPAKTKLEKYGL